MWRVAAVAIFLAIGIWLAVDVLVVTDPERVEAEIARLADLARRGGTEAAEELLAAFADDYRGEGAYARDNVASYVRRYVAQRRLEDLETGDPKALRLGDEIVVPILRLRARTTDFEANLLLRVTFAKRAGRFRITDAEPWRLER